MSLQRHPTTTFPASQMLRPKQRVDIKSKLKFLDEGWLLENKKVDQRHFPHIQNYLATLAETLTNSNY